jgi:hypothetical protein
MVLEAGRLGVPGRLLANVGLDYLIDLVPLLGDLADPA